MELGIPEMLTDSISFDLNGDMNVIYGCYADTASIGYFVKGNSNIIINCGFFNNKFMGLRNTVAIKNQSSKLIVSNSFFSNPTGTDAFYKGNPNAVIWENNNVPKRGTFDPNSAAN